MSKSNGSAGSSNSGVDFSELLFQSKNLTAGENCEGNFRKKLRGAFVQAPNAYNPEERLDGSCSIEGFMQHHHDMIISTAIEDAKKAAAADVKLMYQSLAAREWDDAKNKMMQRLGYRKYRSGTGGGAGGGTGSGGGGRGRAALFGSTSSSASSMPMANRFPRLAAKPPVAAAGSVLMSSHVQLLRSALLAPLQATSHGGGAGRNGAAAAAASSLALTLSESDDAFKGLQSDTSSSFAPADEDSYRAMMHLLSDMVGESRTMQSVDAAGGSHATAPPPGHYAPLMYADKATEAGPAGRAVRQRQYQLTCGSLSYFQRLYWNYMQTVNENALQQGQISAMPPAAPGHVNRRNLLLYLHNIQQSVGYAQAAYQFQGTLNPEVQYCVSLGGEDRDLVTAVPVWIFVYYCLRVGEFDLAIEELQQQQRGQSAGGGRGSGGVGDKALLVDVVLSMLMQLKQHQAMQQRGPAAGASSGESLVQSVVQCRKLHGNYAVAVKSARDRRRGNNRSMDDDDDDEMAYTDEDSHVIEPYAMQVLRICGLTDLDVASDNNKNNHVNITNTVEDYLWVHVWYVWLAHIVSATNNALRSPVADLVASASTYTEANFHSIIESFGGQSYFDPNYTQPFTYVNVLLCCQRYGEAVMHLWVAGKSFAAVQLMTVCVYYGILIPHVKLLHNASAAATDMYHQQGSSNSMHLLHEFTPISLVQQWVQGYVHNYPVQVVEYLVVLQRNAWFDHLGESCDAAAKDKHRLESQQALHAMWVSYVKQVMDVDFKRSSGSVSSSAGASNSVKDREYLNILIGTSVDDNTRDCRRAANGYLDQYSSYFPTSDYVNSIISQVAHSLLDEYKRSNNSGGLTSSSSSSSSFSASSRGVVMKGHFEEDALHLFTLAGNYVDVMEELCRHLCIILSSSVTATGSTGGAGAGGTNNGSSPVSVTITLLPNATTPSSDTAAAAYWVEKCHTFYAKYIQGGNGMVMRTLAAQNRLDLPQTLEALLTVTSMLDNFSHGQFAEVMNIVDRLAVLPTSSAEITSKAEGYYAMDKYVKNVMSDVLLVTMQSIKILHDHYNVVKRGQSMFVGGGSTTGGQSILGGSGNGNSSAVASETDRIITNLQDRSKLLYMYVEVVKARGWSKPDYLAHIHRICHTIM